MSGVAPGIEEMQSLQAAGFAPNEIDTWKAETTGKLQDAGFSITEVNEYFGVRDPDMKPTQDYLEANLAKRAATEPATPTAPAVQEPVNPIPGQKEAKGFLDAIEAGFDMSVTGLLKGRPDMVLPENAGMFMRIASQVGTIAGDIPAMIAGAVGGGGAGAGLGTVTLPVVGTIGLGAVGAAGGAFAAPEGMRTLLMQQYEKGDVKSFGDFWERASATFISSAKGFVIGATTAGAGGLAAKTAGKMALPALAKTTAQLTAEVATMTTVGAALEGHMPEPEHFIEGALLVGGMHGALAAPKVIAKMRNTYAATGKTPTQIALEADADMNLKQQLLADNRPVPIGGEFGAKVVTPPEVFEVTKPLRAAKAELSPEVNTILGKVKEGADKTVKDKVTAGVEAFKESVSSANLYKNFVDKLDPINQATKILKGAKELPADQNPYVLARTAVDAQSKARHMFENGALDYNSLNNKGGSLRSAIESVESVETLEAYMISKRVLEKNKQGVQTGFDVAAAEKVVKDFGPKYEAAAKKVTEFSNNVLQYVSDSGVISKESLARMVEANRDYVPFKRIMDAEGTGGKRQGKAGSLKEFKGSERGIQSPIQSIVENTIELVKMAEQNRPKQALVALAESVPGQELIRKVKTPVEEVTVSKEQVAKQLGISPEAADAVSMFKAVNKELAPNQFQVFKDGKRQIYETTPELAEAVQRLGGDATSTNMFFKILNGFTTVKKIGITFTPEFIAKNFFRDQLTAATFSKSKGINPMDVVSAMGDIWKKNDTYYEWMKSGGANGAFLDLGNRYITTDIYKLQRETNFMNSVRNLVQKPVDAMRVAAELSEQSLRVAEFKKVREAGGSLTEGGFASREITIDFQRVGAKISALNSMTAFMNVSIQGLDRTTRAFKENPTGVAAKAAAYITTPSVLLWWANKDDERYREIPRWEKDLFWHVITDNWQDGTPEEANGLPAYLVKSEGGKTQINKGTIYRFPKPQELGIIFGSLPERVLESFFTDNPTAFKDFSETMKGLITPSFVPDAISPAIEQYFNQSFFTGREIVPYHLKDIMPEYQFVEYTSETAKTLGKFVSTVWDRDSDLASPMVLDNYIRSWGGQLGQYANQTAEFALKKAGVIPDLDPTSTLSDIPFIKSFVTRFPQAQSNSVKDFNESYQKSVQVMATIKYLAKQGDFASMEKELMLQANQQNMVRLDGIKEALSSQSNFIRLIQQNPEITKDEKRQMIDSAYLMMIESAKQGNVIMREIKKQLGE